MEAVNAAAHSFRPTDLLRSCFAALFWLLRGVLLRKTGRWTDL